MNVENIKPDASGKYSPLLYKWLKSKRFSRARQVFQSGTMNDFSVYSDHWRPREIIIGNLNDGFVSGRRLGDIICGVHGVKSNSFAYFAHSFNLREITEEFWAKYERIGRCAWDHPHSLHMIGSQGRWHYIAGVRKRECAWCGRVFEAETRTVVETKEITSWVEYQSKAPATLLFPCDDMGRDVFGRG